MIAHVARWGNSLALRIPARLAQRLSVKEGRSVEIEVEDGRLVVRPIDDTPRYDLEGLIAGMGPDMADEAFAGGPVAHESF